MKSNKIKPFLAGLLLITTFSFNISAQKSLKDVFQDYFLIGASLNRAQIFEEDKIGVEIVKQQFNTISPENVLKWGLVHPQSDLYDFKASDKYVDFGEKNKLFTIGHTLIWHNQTPAWVFTDSQGKLLNREKLLKRMRDHIQTVVRRYKGKIKGWDVVNEALNEDGTLRQSPWLKIIGSDYIAKAFQFAHEADPDAELYYNDFSLENEQKLKGAIGIVKILLSENIPITAVGLQGHDNLTFPTITQQDHAISEITKLGIKVNITELDISVLPDPEGFSGAEVNTNFSLMEKLNPYQTGLPLEIQQKLAQRYADLFGVFIKHYQDISRITFWNVTDRDSWLNNFPVRGRKNYPLLFDRDGKKKLAFFSVLQIIDNTRFKDNINDMK